MPLPGSHHTAASLANRQAVCASCDQWQNGCLLGHRLESSFGCPRRLFSPIGGAGYWQPSAQPKTGLTWPGVLELFAKAMLRWAKDGFKLASAQLHKERYDQCRPGGDKPPCPSFNGFRCLDCGCVAYLKAKVLAESCPRRRWPR